MYSESKEQIEKRFDGVIEELNGIKDQLSVSGSLVIENLMHDINYLKDLSYTSGYHDGWYDKEGIHTVNGNQTLEVDVDGLKKWQVGATNPLSEG